MQTRDNNNNDNTKKVMSETTTTAAQRTFTVDAERFKNSVFVRLTIRRWGNRAQVRNAEALAAYLLQQEQEIAENPEAKANPLLEIDAATAKAIKSAKLGSLKVTKPLIRSAALNAINDALNSGKKRILSLCVPSTVQPGMFVASPAAAQKIERIIEEVQSELALNLLPKFQDDFAPAIERARTDKIINGGLGPLFNAQDYPDSDAAVQCFGLENYFWSLKVPDNLPAEMRAAQQEKLEKTFTEAAETVTLALREGFQEMIQHATEKLAPKADGTKNIFRDSLVGNIQEFIDCFADRNIMNDSQLAALVEQAKGVLTGIQGRNGQSAADALRTNDELRENARKQFAAINQQLGAAIEEQKERAFDFSADAEG